MQLVLDMYSGRPNPSWQLPPLLATRLFELIMDAGLPKLQSTPFPARLGFRGIELELPTSIVQRYRVAPWLRISADSAFDHKAVFNETIALSRFMSFPSMDELVQKLKAILGGKQPRGGPPQPVPTAGPCRFDMLPFDTSPWDDPAFITNNNCYAYASNKRSNYTSKPQPGIGSGKMFTSITGAEVKSAAKRDGAHDVNDCFPDSEAPIMLVALVMWPGEDYHWYRKHPDCWGHKQGSNLARKFDDSGKLITDPATCDRGNYTEFVGYMLLPKSLKVAA